jgi:hypothetical protein
VYLQVVTKLAGIETEELMYKTREEQVSYPTIKQGILSFLCLSLRKILCLMYHCGQFFFFKSLSLSIKGKLCFVQNEFATTVYWFEGHSVSQVIFLGWACTCEGIIYIPI